jgi:ABC-type uncharacterized transport system ATPase subunit
MFFPLDPQPQLNHIMIAMNQQEDSATQDSYLEKNEVEKKKKKKQQLLIKGKVRKNNIILACC